MKEQNHLKEDQKKWTACELNMSVTAKGLNTYDHVIFQFFFFNKFAKISTFLFFFSVKMGAECTLMRNKINFFDFSKWLQ